MHRQYISQNSNLYIDSNILYYFKNVNNYKGVVAKPAFLVFFVKKKTSSFLKSQCRVYNFWFIFGRLGKSHRQKCRQQ
jgi:hypothetical protein